MVHSSATPDPDIADGMNMEHHLGWSACIERTIQLFGMIAIGPLAASCAALPDVRYLDSSLVPPANPSVSNAQGPQQKKPNPCWPDVKIRMPESVHLVEEGLRRAYRADAIVDDIDLTPARWRAIRRSAKRTPNSSWSKR